ncbi:MAG: ATPase, T2SS/T4P/T4SS family, partial [Syntrophorhabdaceae bacterium]|nr:ATPase, T2SS/T4P/T4SS family [Syntrophorhabdaceae bacterium]
MADDGIIYVKPEDFPKVPLVLDVISPRFIRENKIIPVELKNNVLKVILANPGDREIIEALRVATAADIIVYGGDRQLIDDYVSRFYDQGPQNINRIIEDMDQQGFEFIREEEEDVGHLKDLASEAPIIKLVNLLISRAIESRASDIHIEPFEDELKVRYRIDGVLHDVEAAPKKLEAAVVSRIKIMAKL